MTPSQTAAAPETTEKKIERRRRGRAPRATPELQANLWLTGFGFFVCVFLLWFGLRYAHLLNPPVTPTVFPPAAGTPAGGTAPVVPVDPFRVHPLIDLLKLVMAASIGIVVTEVHKRGHREEPLTQSMLHSQILLAVAGALMMVLIGESVARAFGIAGAAAIIRFRTPVANPKDATILFLQMALGMAAGLGAFAVAGLGTIFLCLFLLVLDLVEKERLKPREVLLEVVANEDFPTNEVHTVFANFRLSYEPREVSHGKGGKGTTVRYLITLSATTDLEDLSERLMGLGGAGLKSVAWEKPKKKWTI